MPPTFNCQAGKNIPLLLFIDSTILQTFFLLSSAVFPWHGWNGTYRIQPNGPRGMAEYQPETPPEGRQARGRRRGLVSSHTARTIGLYPTYHMHEKECFCGR